MKVPLRIYYDKQNGQVLQMTGNYNDEGLKQYETIDEQILKYTALSERNRDTFDVIELPFGAYAQDFTECNGYRVNVTTKKLEFSYPDPNAPEAPQVFAKPLTEHVADLESQNLDLMLAIAEMAEATEQSKTETQLAVAELAEIITGGA